VGDDLRKHLLTFAEVGSALPPLLDEGPDLVPSVYDVTNRDETVRACAEHSTMFDPDRTTLAVDVSGAANTIREVAGNPAFAFIRGRHREVVLQDADALRGFIGELVSNLPERGHLMSLGQVGRYNLRVVTVDHYITR